LGKFSSNLDEIDAIAMMRALGAIHEGRAELIISPLGDGSNTGVVCKFRMNFDVLPDSQLPSIVEVSQPWPCKVCKSFWGHVYNGLYALDVAIGGRYSQDELFPKGPDTPV
jgi:hypothetical protein